MQETQPVKYRGVPFESGDETLIVPPINFEMAEAISPEIDAQLSNEDPKQRIQGMLKVIQSALQRNYPNLTIEQVKQHFSYDSINEAYLAAQGLDRKSQKVKSPGELKPAQ